jgi:dihydroorotate dehydrogenase
VADLAVDLAGIKMKNPVMSASGTFGSGVEYAGVLVGYFVFILVKKIIPRSLAQPCANLLMDHSK